MVLDDIISILSDSKGSLTDALLKTKVLLHQIGTKELATWVTNELTGYPDDKKENVPDYRQVGMQVRGHVIGYNMQHTNYPLPIRHLKNKAQENLTLCLFTESIANIEGIVENSRVSDGKKGQLQRPLPVEFGASINKVLTPGTNVVSAWCDINMLQVENILTQVRSRLLDFCLELKDAVGDTPVKELPAKAQEIQADKLFTTAIYNTGGTVIVGSANIQVNNKQDDVEGLISEIAKLGYEKKYLDELRRAVLEDKNKPDVAEGATNEWFTKALKEAGKGVVKVGVDVAASVITQAIKHFSGS